MHFGVLTLDTIIIIFNIIKINLHLVIDVADVEVDATQWPPFGHHFEGVQEGLKNYIGPTSKISKTKSH